MMVSTKGRYALRIMADLAENQEGGPVSLKDIAERENIGIKYLEIIVSSLNKNGLLKSVRGKNGGYMLNREPKEYTIASILNAASCKTYVLWKELDDVIEDFLSSKTLADIL